MSDRARRGLPSPTSAPPRSGLGVGAVLERQAARLGDRPFLNCPDARLTYRELDELAGRTAGLLRSLGVGPGDLVPVLSGNLAAVVVAWFACARLGAIFAPVNSLLSGESLADVLRHSNARLILCDPVRCARVAALRPQLPALARLIVFGGPVPSGTLSFDQLVSRSPRWEERRTREEPGALSKLLYTSGTTGTPKGALWSRQCEAVWTRAYGDELLPIAEGEMLYTCLPLSHVTAQGTVMAALWRGGQVTVDLGFRPLTFWGRVRAVGAVGFTFVGTILAVLAGRPNRPDDGDNPVRRIVGAATPAASWREIERRFRVTIVETWGQTETASCWMRPERLPQRPGTVGVPSPRFGARLASVEEGATVAVGAVGELWMRPNSPHVMFEGYLRDGEGAPPWTPDGWYRTGDLMRQEPDGAYVFVGRLREAIRRRGELIPAGTVERAALADPAVVQAAAVGVPDDRGVEEEIKLCVVGRNGEQLDPGALHASLGRRLPEFMVPRYIDVRSALPTTPSTRVRRVELARAGIEGVWDARRPRQSRVAAPNDLA